MSEIRAFRLPDLGEGLTESEVLSWRVGVGDTVALNQIIAEVETAKAVVELPAPYAGTVRHIYAEPGVTVNVGEPLLDVEVADEEARTPAGGADPPTVPLDIVAAGSPAADGPAAGEQAAESPAADEPTQPNLVGYGAPAESGGGPVRRARRRLATEAISVVPVTGRTGGRAGQGQGGQPGGSGDDGHGSAERTRSTPPVRKLAHDLGIELDGLHGSGEGGAVTREDVEAAFAGRFAAGAAAGPAAAAPVGDSGGAARAGESGGAAREARAGDSGGAAREARAGDSGGAARETRIPVHGVRKLTAAAMVQSAFTAPHVSCSLSVDATRTVELLGELEADRLRAQSAQAAAAPVPPRIGLLAVVASAVCIAARRTPELNAHWDEDRHEIVQFHYVNLGIAVATPRGLVVPVIVDADGMGLEALAAAIARLGEEARAGATPPQAMRGGTFSISNVGVFGVDTGTAIINPGEAGILALGALRRQPHEWQGEIALRDVVTLSLSFDHRLVDGQQGAAFLRDVGAIVNNPGRALTMV